MTNYVKRKLKHMRILIIKANQAMFNLTSREVIGHLEITHPSIIIKLLKMMIQMILMTVVAAPKLLILLKLNIHFLLKKFITMN